MLKFELQVLGTGAGASMVYQGLNSTSFMLLKDEKPICLIDLGLGIGREVIETFGNFPKDIIVTHNHSDHAGDLPVVLRVEQAQGNRCRVIAQQEVVERLKLHRLAEHSEQINSEDLADWLSIPSESFAEVGEGLGIQFFPAHHSELSFGFMLYFMKQPLFAYTADSTLYKPLYTALDMAPVFIMDARARSNDWHASFDEVKPWLKKGRYIAGHGLNLDEVKQYPELPLLKKGDRITLALGKY